MSNTITMDFTKKKKNNQMQQPTVSQSAQMASTQKSNRPYYTQGISTQQGNYGQGQGANGYNMIGNLARSMQTAPSYNAPKITKSMLTQEGFNQALGRIQARNNAKLQMQNRRVMGGVLGSLLQSRSADYRTDTSRLNNMVDNKTRLTLGYLKDTTDRRGQDIASGDRRSNQKIMKDYYTGLLSNQLKGQQTQKEVAQIGAEARTTPKQVSPEDVMLKRQKLFDSPDAFKSVLPEDVRDEISDDNAAKAYYQYLKTGEIPNFQKQSGFFDDDYTPIQDRIQGSQSQQQNQQQQQSKPVATGKLFDALANDLKVDRSQLKLSDDGSSIIFPDGSMAPVDAIAKSLGV